MSFCDVEKNLKTKVQCLSGLGLSSSDLFKVILRDGTIFQRGLDTHIRPVLNSLRDLLGSDENVVVLLKRASWLITYNSHGSLEANLNVLRSFCSNDKIKNFVMVCPKILKINAKKLEEMLHRVKKKSVFLVTRQCFSTLFVCLRASID